MEPEWKRKKKAKAYRKIYLLYGSDGALGQNLCRGGETLPRVVWQISKIRKSLLHP